MHFGTLMFQTAFQLTIDGIWHINVSYGVTRKCKKIKLSRAICNQEQRYISHVINVFSKLSNWIYPDIVSYWYNHLLCNLVSKTETMTPQDAKEHLEIKDFNTPLWSNLRSFFLYCPCLENETQSVSLKDDKIYSFIWNVKSSDQRLVLRKRICVSVRLLNSAVLVLVNIWIYFYSVFLNVYSSLI